MSAPEAPRVDPATLKTAKTTASARRRQHGVFSRFRHWLGLHAHGLLSSLGRMLRRPLAAAMTVGMMAIAIVLPVALWLVLANVQRLSGSVQTARQVTVFLHPDVRMDRADAIAAQLRARHDVTAVSVRSPADGLAEMRKMSDLAPAVDALDANPLPPVLLIDPSDDGAGVAASLKAMPEVDVVQQDAIWRERLSAWLALGQRLVWVLATLLGTGALLVVGNTVRLDIANRADEIGVLQLLGATDGFVRRPFLYLGALYGLAAGALALGLLAIAGAVLQPTLARLLAAYGNDFRLHGPGGIGMTALLIGPLLLGWLGAWLATGHHLRANQPVGA